MASAAAAVAMPTEVVTYPASGNGVSAIARRRRAAASRASSGPAWGSSQANSSPPVRPTASPARMWADMSSPIARSTASATRAP